MCSVKFSEEFYKCKKLPVLDIVFSKIALYNFTRNEPN